MPLAMLRGVIGRRDLQDLAHTRLREAEALYAAGLYDGSVYLCGYVLEMALKACVCKTLDIPGYPDTEPGIRQFLKTHDFGTLELLAGLRSRVAEQNGYRPSLNGHGIGLFYGM